MQPDDKIVVSGQFYFRNSSEEFSNTSIARIYGQKDIDLISSSDDGISDSDDSTSITQPVFTGSCLGSVSVDILLGISG